eukprot:01487.XXX_1108_1821_1 [CDS] Oithona nana genome sequencing.
MKKYQVQILAVDGSLKEEPKNFQLEDNATIEDLKKAFSKADHIYHPDQLRLSYKTASGKLPLEDDDHLEDILAKYEGDFVLQCPHLSSIDGTVYISKKVPELVSVLVGSTKSFEHHKITHDNDHKHNLPIPLAKLNFLWSINKLAIVEEETRIDYVTYQYEIDDRWRLVISKNENPKGDGPHPKWMLSREEASGELTQL